MLDVVLDSVVTLEGGVAVVEAVVARLLEITVAVLIVLLVVVADPAEMVVLGGVVVVVAIGVTELVVVDASVIEATEETVVLIVVVIAVVGSLVVVVFTEVVGAEDTVLIIAEIVVDDRLVSGVEVVVLVVLTDTKPRFTSISRGISSRHHPPLTGLTEKSRIRARVTWQQDNNIVIVNAEAGRALEVGNVTWKRPCTPPNRYRG